MEPKKTKIQQIYDNPKAKGFVNHLISAYVPVNKICKVFSFEKNHNKEHICDICKTALLSIDEVMFNMQQKRDEITKDFVQSLKDQVNGKPSENAFAKHAANGKILAFTGKKTDTIICHSCAQDLLEMVTSNLLMGDKNIEWKLNQTRRQEMFDTFDESPSLDPEEKSRVKKIAKKVEVNKEK